MGDYENTHTHTALTQDQEQGWKLQSYRIPWEGVIRPSGGGGAESGGAVILWSAQILLEGAEGQGMGEFSLPGIQGSWKGSWEIGYIG